MLLRQVVRRCLATAPPPTTTTPPPTPPTVVFVEKFGVVVKQERRKKEQKPKQQPQRRELSTSTRLFAEKFGVAVSTTTSPALRRPVQHWNLGYDELFVREQSEGLQETSQGAMAVDTGKYTGRSPKDKYFVREPSSEENLDWGSVNQPMNSEVYDTLKNKVIEHLGSKSELYVYEGQAASGVHRLPLRVVTEFAWQHHFCKNMFREKEADGGTPFVIYNASNLQLKEAEKLGLNSEAFVAFHLGKREAIIGGTSYAGEMKKGIFSVMNYLKPLENVLPMHCAANVGVKKDVALFYGLSGTGKTTLSTDETRSLVGDDEHLWDDVGISNIEGGCYAKTINLDPESEPTIYKAIKKNALLENVDIKNGVVDYGSSRKTQNTRVSYPLHHVENTTDVVGHPTTIIFLACDAFGVLPPVAKLAPQEAAYHFLSGYTSKVAGTERGVTDPVATFSACYGSAFLPLHPTAYARLLQKKMQKHDVRAFLVNTGWTGGPPGVGHRMPIHLTRRILNSVFQNGLDHDDFIRHPILNLSVPNTLVDLSSDVLHPWTSWVSQTDYDNAANHLATLFVQNFSQYNDPDIANYGPRPSF